MAANARPKVPDGEGPLGLDSSTLIAMGGFVLGFATIVVLLTGALGGLDVMAYICVPGGIIPGAVALTWGFVIRQKEQRVQEFAEWLSTKRRIPMDDIARSIGRNRMEMERLLGKAERRGLVRGVVDRSSDEWVSEDAIGKQVFVAQCPSCGGQVNRWMFPEEYAQCPYCGAGVTTASTLASAR
jgi:hypothetical protein